MLIIHLYSTLQPKWRHYLVDKLRDDGSKKTKQSGDLFK